MEQEDIWDKEFPITSVTRADLKEAGIEKNVIVHLTDEDMERIARKMGDIYCDHGFWDDVITALEYVLERKQVND